MGKILASGKLKILFKRNIPKYSITKPLSNCRTCDSKPTSDMSNWTNLLEEHVNFDTEPHFSKANSLERLGHCSKSYGKQRLELNFMEKCKHKFELEKDDAGNITLKWSGNLYETNKFCLDIKNGSLIAEVCVEKSNSRDKFK